jgi:hypothetical protein
MPNPEIEADLRGFGRERVYPAEVLASPAILGTSQTPEPAGVTGVNTVAGPGVHGDSKDGIGVVGESTGHDGVQGRSQHPGHAGVAGIGEMGVGVVGESKGHDGVRGTTHHKDHAGVAGVNDGGGIGIYGKGAIAGFFEGSVTMTGSLTIANGCDVCLADFAEDFDVAAQEDIEPGTVVTLDEAGAVQTSRRPYDKRVAGVISGARNFRPAITLDRSPSRNSRLPVALVGKVYCKVDADSAPIAVGDLLTTSPTPGHAMKAEDAVKSFGAVIGKALRPLNAGQGLIPMLIALQ